MNKRLHEYIRDRFYEKGETPAGFARNTIYSKQSVDDVIKGIIQSGAIRRDISQYLGYRDWTALVSS